MKPNEFQQLTPQALVAKISEMKAEYFDQRAQVLSGKQKNSAALQQLRRNIARALTYQGRAD
jgi:ribosomal protein L29